jgi:hypothetical protein
VKYLIRGFATCGLVIEGIAWVAGGHPSALGTTASGLAFAGSMFWDGLAAPTPRDTDTQQIAFLRERYVKGDMEAEEFERDLDRLLRPAHTYFEVTPGRWMTYAQESLADTEPHYGC